MRRERAMRARFAARCLHAQRAQRSECAAILCFFITLLTAPAAACIFAAIFEAAYISPRICRHA